MNQYVTGAVIKELREKNNLTQSELATILNVSDKDIRIYPYRNRLQMHLEYLLRNFYRGMQSQT